MSASILCFALGLAADPAAAQSLYSQTGSQTRFPPAVSTADYWVGRRGTYPVTSQYALGPPVSNVSWVSAQLPQTYADDVVVDLGQPALVPDGPTFVPGGGVVQAGPAPAPYTAYQPGYVPYGAYPDPYWYPSDWTIRAGAIFLKREDPGSVTIINSPAGVEAFNSSSFDFDYETGYELSLLRVLPSGYQLEFRYFNLDDWSDTQSLVTAVGGSIATTPPTPFGGAAGVLLDYSSELQGLEANLRLPVNPGLNVFAGFRWVDLDESMRANFAFVGPIAAYDVEVDNDLYGLQIGADGAMWDNGIFRLEYLAKIGLFGNDASQRSTLVQIGPPLAGSASSSGGDTAFLAELGLTGVYQINRHWSVRGGYSVMWIDGVALAADQTPNTGFLSAGPTTSSLDTGTVFYHGAHLGLELRW